MRRSPFLVQTTPFVRYSPSFALRTIPNLAFEFFLVEGARSPATIRQLLLQHTACAKIRGISVNRICTRVIGDIQCTLLAQCLLDFGETLSHDLSPFNEVAVLGDLAFASHGRCLILPFQAVHQGRSQGSILGYINGIPITYSAKSLHLLGGTNHGLSPVTSCSHFLGGGKSPSLVRNVTTIFNPLTEEVALFLLHLEMVVTQALKTFAGQLIMLSCGFFIEGATVQELTLTPRSLGGGRTHKQIINIGPYRGRQVPDAVDDHSLVDLWSHFHPHGQDVPLIHSVRGIWWNPSSRSRMVQRWFPCCRWRRSSMTDRGGLMSLET